MKYFVILAIAFTFLPAFAEEVSVFDAENKELKGSLNIAKGNSSLAVLILSGSGPTDRNGNTLGAPGKNNCLKYLSDILNEEGMTTLRVDKRGVGASSSAAMKESELRFDTYVEDAKAWIGFLESRGYSKIVLIGHSEGALVATLAASSSPVTGLICIAGAGRKASAILREQLISQLPKELYSEADATISKLEEGMVVGDFPPALNSLFRASVQPYLISWFQIDPVKSISKVQVPTLIIQGSTDLQTSAKDANMLHQGAPGSKLIIIGGMNHVLKEMDGDLSSQMPSYFNPDLPLHKDLKEKVVAFLRELSDQATE